MGSVTLHAGRGRFLIASERGSTRSVDDKRGRGKWKKCRG